MKRRSRSSGRTAAIASVRPSRRSASLSRTAPPSDEMGPASNTARRRRRPENENSACDARIVVATRDADPKFLHRARGHHMHAIASVVGLDPHHEPLVVSERRLFAPHKRLDQSYQIRLRFSALAELLQERLALLSDDYAIPDQRRHRQLELPLPGRPTLAQQFRPRELDQRVRHPPLGLLAGQLDRPPRIAIPVARLRLLASHARNLPRASDAPTP